MDPTSEAALKLEIARLTGAINRHKTGLPPTSSTTHAARSNVYINPNYKPAPQGNRSSTSFSQSRSRPDVTRPAAPASTKTKDVVIGGVTFESSGRSLVRKDLPKPQSNSSTSAPTRVLSARSVPWINGHPVTAHHTKIKPSSRGRHPSTRHMTLENSKRPFPPGRLINKRMRYSDKPCVRFSTTGACGRGLTCPYQHDPSKIAICWNFLQGNCPNNADACNLSHEPTPERTPLCLHFANNGRCTRERCPFPHVRVTPRQGVCRDFAVLGYCDKGLDCDKQHVRECPDFAEKGSCMTKGCKLPHVIRANRNRRQVTPPATATATATRNAEAVPTTGSSRSSEQAGAAFSGTADQVSTPQPTSPEAAQVGDDFISLTFIESESESDSEGDISE